jgi:hypothetical protein
VARSYVTLAEHPGDMVRLACTKCERRGQYRKATLIERYGGDANMVDLRLTLAAVWLAAGQGHGPVAAGQSRHDGRLRQSRGSASKKYGFLLIWYHR